MYNNTGEKIKNRASVMCGVKIFFNFVVGLFFFAYFLVFANMTGAEWPEWAPEWLPFLLLFLAIYFFLVRSVGAWNQYLLMAAYGELVEETTKSATQLEEIKKILLRSVPEKEELLEEKTDVVDINTKAP